jgi:hypothetical protein
MNYPNTAFRFALIVLVLLFALPVMAAKPTKGNKASSAPKAQSSLREIEYPDLENKVGEKLVIYTTNNTTRSGVLVRYTNVSLTLQLGPESGPIELSALRSTIRKVMIEIGPADPLFIDETTKHEGKSGAKKN